MIRHIVLIKPKNKKKIDTIKNVLEDLILGLDEKVEGIESVEIGEDFSERSKGYSYIFILTFKNEGALLDWKDNEYHIPIKNILTSVADMLVFDYKLEI